MSNFLSWRMACLAALLCLSTLAAQARAQFGGVPTPYLHYTFDNAAMLGQDTSGNGRHANIVAPATQSTTNKVFGTGAINLTGGGYIDMSAAILASNFNTGPNAGAATLAVWTRMNLAAQPDGFDSLGTTGAANSHFTWTDGLGYYRTFRNNRVDAIAYPWDLDADPNNNGDEVNWHHLAITNDPTNDPSTLALDGWKLYIDGNLIKTAPFELFANLGNEWLGRNDLGPPNSHEGLFDEVWLFNQALTQAQIQQLFLNNATPEPSSIFVWAVGGLGACVFAWRRAKRK